MDNKLKELFDYQRFQDNKRLAHMIADAQASLTHRLSDDELAMVSAAGDRPVGPLEDIRHDS